MPISFVMKHIYPITVIVMLAVSVCLLLIGVRPSGHPQINAGHQPVP